MVSGRWRALTHAHSRPTSENWKDELYKKLRSILVIASWGIRTSENEEPYGNRVTSFFFKAINELRVAIGENCTSVDLEIFVYECDTIFDPVSMEDPYSVSSGKRAPEAIVGTVGIGLAEEHSTKYAINLRTVIPAKVVLTSTMNEVLELPPPRRSKKALKKPIEITDGANQDGRD